MTTFFLNELKNNETINDLMKAKNLKATKEEREIKSLTGAAQTDTTYLIGDYQVSRVIRGSRGGVRVEQNTGLVELLTYLHKA